MLALGKLLELTLAGREPAQKTQMTVGGVRLRWLGEGALEVRPPKDEAAAEEAPKKAPAKKPAAKKAAAKD